MEPWEIFSSGEQSKPVASEQANTSGTDTSSSAPIVITEVTTTRTILVNKDADLTNPQIAELVAQLRSQAPLSPPEVSTTSSSVLGAHYIPLTGQHEDVHYTSEEEGHTSNRMHRQPLSKFTNERSTSGGHHRHSKNGGWSPPRPSSPSPSPSSKTKSTNKPAEDILAPLGSFYELDLTSEVSKMIKSYAKNSIISNKRSGGGSLRIKVKVRNIYKKGGKVTKFLQGCSGGSVTKSEPKGKKKSQGKGHHSSTGNSNDLSMLLWFKTSPDSIKALAAERNSCTAFYDRLSRALPQPVDKIKEGLRQTILLCKVSLGNSYKSPHGYSHWHKCSHPPSGFDSVKGVGQFKPNWTRNVQLKSTLVPIGETEKSNRFSSFEIDYNEYFIFNSNRIKVKYAVDIEFMTRKEH